MVPLTVRWMFLGIVLTCGDYTSDTVEMNEKQLRELLESSWSVPRAMDALKEIQVLSYDKITLFLNRIEKKVKEEKRNFVKEQQPKNGSVEPGQNPTDFAPNKTKIFISNYCDLFKARYGSNPVINGKISGIAKRLAESLGEEKSKLYLEAFFAMPDAFLVKNRHPLAQFEFKLNEITVFANSGKFTTTRQAQQNDQSATTSNLLNDIRAGRV